MSGPSRSETDFLAGQRCAKLLWHRWHRPELLPPVVESDEEARVRRLAQELFPDGQSVLLNLNPNRNLNLLAQTPHPETGDLDARLSASRTALRQRIPWFDTAFIYNGCIAQPDLLRPSFEDGWDLIGITSAVRAPRWLLERLAFQAHVLNGAEVGIRRVLALHLNASYVRQEREVDPRQLFVFKEVTRVVAQSSRAMENLLAERGAVVGRQASPEPGLGTYCEIPGDCPLKAHCWSVLPEHNVFDLHKIRREQAFALARAGLTSMNLLPEKLRATRHRQIQLTTLATQRPHVDRKAIAAFLGRLRYPLYCLDFETLALAVPPFAGLRPWEMYPFQFSLHVVSDPVGTRSCVSESGHAVGIRESDVSFPTEARGHAGGCPVQALHYSFLSDGRSDPRPEILWRLRDWLGARGSLLAYNAGFEIGVLDYLGQFFPEFQSWVAGLRPRFVDVLAPFKAFAFYHPAQKGSASLKTVLPALTGRDYADLAIRDGNTAGAEYARVTFGEVAPEERQRVRAQLEQYCGRDTEGMVWIVEALQRMA